MFLAPRISAVHGVSYIKLHDLKILNRLGLYIFFHT